jgi:Predicted nucleotide-binding protein containing TIR-like domain
MAFKRRVFMSIQNPDLLQGPRRAVQDEIIRKVEKLEYQPEIFFIAGRAAALPWSLPNAVDVMQRCVGVVVLAMRRWTVNDPQAGEFHFASEYAQIEGAMATVLGLPLLLVAERGLVDRGITWTGAGHPILYMPPDDATWLSSDAFSHRFSIWQDQLAARADVFLGYSSKARATAQAVHIFLKERLGLKIRNWELDFAAAGNILDEIEIAARLCTGGIFLFTKDDALLEGDATRAAPRDNVVFEAGFFAAARGRGRVLIIREEGAKMPADLGGNIYLSLRDRNEVGQIESGIREFVEKRL